MPSKAGEPMTLANMRENRVRHVTLYCALPCNHSTDILVDDLPPDIHVRAIGSRYRCSLCGRKGPESRPAWGRKERT